MQKVKSRMMTGLLVLALLPLIASTQSIDSARRVIHEFSVQQALDYAKKNNVQVRNALLDVQIQEQTNKDLTSAAYPQINGSFSLVDNVKPPISLIPAEFFGGTP